MSQHRLRRLVTAGAFAAAIVTAPAVLLVAGPASGPAPQQLAACDGIPVGLQGVGAYTDNCDLAVQPAPAIGAAPGAGAIIACRRIAGCLSQVVNNPGQVQVPQRSTAIQNSQ
jgi:hypothetical protein